ncbi:MAG TPA: hypothetical protein VGR02_02910 [Thermoanaerobaculia bacterium]|jgi:hypothetical protein|nr:hypothetical protein [Thermoanaerobaculia bacterium]
MTPRVAIALVALVACALFALPLARGEVFTFRDHTDYFQPLRFFTAQQLRAGQLPLWNPYNASGEPWLANPQTGVFYPPSWVFLALPFAAAYMLYLLLHLLILGVTSFRLFARDASPGAAAFGAIALMLCGPTLSMLDVSNNLASFAWIPLVIHAALGRRPILGGIALALTFLGGEPFFAALAALLFLLLAARRSLLAGCVAFGLSAVQLLPFLETLRDSDRTAGVTGVVAEAMKPMDWLRIVMRPALDPRGFDPHLSQHYVPVIYIGVVVVLLALVNVGPALSRPEPGIPDLPRSRPAESRPYIALLLLGGAVLLSAIALPLVRYPSRVVPFGALALAALAVRGLDRIPRRKWWLDGAVIAVVVAELVPVSLPLLQTEPFPPIRVPYDRAIGRDAKIIRVDLPLARLNDERPQWITGYLNLYERRFDAWTAAPVTSQRYTSLYAAADRGVPAAVDRMSIGWVLAPRYLTRLTLEQVVFAGRVLVHRNTAVLPMARLELADGRIVPARTLAFTPAGAAMEVDAPAPGLLVLTQQDAPGWSVEVDGKPAPKRLSLDLFRAVQVGDGRHVVSWKYRPRSLFFGALITACTLVVLLALSSRARVKNFFASL